MGGREGAHAIPRGEQEHLDEEQWHGDRGDMELWVGSIGRMSFEVVFFILGLQTSEAQVLGSATGFAVDPLGRTVSCGGGSPSVRGW